MTPTDKAEFGRIVIGLSAIKPGKTLTPEGIKLYWLALQHWSIEDFRQAARHLACAVEFMPNPFHFEQLRKAGKPTAGEAFAKALEHASSSAYRSGPLGDPLIDAAVQALGGYIVIAMCDEDKTPFLERRFAEHYETMQDARGTRESLPALTAERRLDGPLPFAKLLPNGHA